MRLIVISDTHSMDLPQVLLDDIGKADLVVHAGDFCDMDVYNRLKALKEIRAVYGNIDGADLRGLLPQKTVFTCESVALGLFHGEGGPDQLLEKVKAAFEARPEVNVIIFGHSHEAFSQVVNGVLYFNPGSPTDSIRPPFRSYGVLEIHGHRVKSTIVRLK